MQGPQGKYPAIKAGDYVKQAFKPQFDAKQVRFACARLPPGSFALHAASSANLVTCNHAV